jgi:hypothetical protein
MLGNPLRTSYLEMRKVVIGPVLDSIGGLQKSGSASGMVSSELVLPDSNRTGTVLAQMEFIALL